MFVCLNLIFTFMIKCIFGVTIQIIIDSFSESNLVPKKDGSFLQEMLTFVSNGNIVHFTKKVKNCQYSKQIFQLCLIITSLLERLFLPLSVLLLYING